MRGTFRCTFASAAILVALAWAAPIAQAQAQAQAAIHFDIPSQPLADSLRAVGSQSNINLLFDPPLVAGYHAPALKAQLTTDQALTRLLSGTEIHHEFLNEKTVILAVAGSRSASAPDESTTLTPSAPQAFNNPETLDTGTAKKPGFWSRFRLAQNEPSSQTDSSPSKDESPPQNSDKNSKGRVIDEIVVTGSHIRGGEPVGSKVIVLDREDIDESGYATVQDVLRTLPQNFAGSQSETTRSVGSALSNDSYGSSVNLRGLGADATLTLVNGRRLAPAGAGTFVDVSAIPLSMIERIEIVPDGASATYGSDAVGGVVNMVLRKKFDGADTRLRYGTLSGEAAPEKQLAQLFGKSWSTGNVLIGYEYYERDSLASAERRYTANSDLRPFGGSDFSSMQSNPGNINRIGTTAVTLAVPRGQDGTALSESQLLAGQTNLENVREFDELLPE